MSSEASAWRAGCAAGCWHRACANVSKLQARTGTESCRPQPPSPATQQEPPSTHLCGKFRGNNVAAPAWTYVAHVSPSSWPERGLFCKKCHRTVENEMKAWFLYALDAPGVQAVPPQTSLLAVQQRCVHRTIFTDGQVRYLIQSRRWSTSTCLSGTGDLAFSWSIFRQGELVLQLFLCADVKGARLVSASLFPQRC